MGTESYYSSPYVDELHPQPGVRESIHPYGIRSFVERNPARGGNPLAGMYPPGVSHPLAPQYMDPRPGPKLDALDNNKWEYFIRGHCALTFCLLVLMVMKRFCTFWKPQHALQQPLMD